MEVKFAAYARNFADLIAALRPPLGGEAPPAWMRGFGGRQPPNVRKRVEGLGLG